MTTRYLNYKHAAAYLDMPEGTLRSMVRRKKIEHFRISRTVALFTEAGLDEWRAGRSMAVAERTTPRTFGGNTSAEHEAAIVRLSPYAQRVGFAAALRILTGVDHGAVIPDAFAIDDITQCIDIFEVEHTSALTDRKLAKLRVLSARLSAIGWTLRLFGAAASSHEWTEIDVETGALAEAEIGKIVRSNHVRFKVP